MFDNQSKMGRVEKFIECKSWRTKPRIEKRIPKESNSGFETKVTRLKSLSTKIKSMTKPYFRYSKTINRVVNITSIGLITYKCFINKSPAGCFLVVLSPTLLRLLNSSFPSLNRRCRRFIFRRMDKDPFIRVLMLLSLLLLFPKVTGAVSFDSEKTRALKKQAYKQLREDLRLLLEPNVGGLAAEIISSPAFQSAVITTVTLCFFTNGNTPILMFQNYVRDMIDAALNLWSDFETLAIEVCNDMEGGRFSEMKFEKKTFERFGRTVFEQRKEYHDSPKFIGTISNDLPQIDVDVNLAVDVDVDPRPLQLLLTDGRENDVD